MSFATVQSCTIVGIHSVPVIVEVHLSGGLPGMSIVGLPQTAVRESKDRVKAAIQYAGYKFPQVKVTVNLAPADLPKQGGRFDLPIALGVLLATQQLPQKCLDGIVAIGELGLTGTLRSVSGVLPSAVALSQSTLSLLVPAVNALEARRSVATSLMWADDFKSLCTSLCDGVFNSDDKLSDNHAGLGTFIPTQKSQVDNASIEVKPAPVALHGPDMADVKGQFMARRALEIAAAGAHNLLFAGPPGAGKSMLASRLPTIQTPMTLQEAIESACITSISYSGFDDNSWGVRPFRAPHHTSTATALVGGGVKPMPGEISLAHNGVLFLDELPEFPRYVLDVLREPMEAGRITISRAARQAEFPARFQLIGAMNPCPCGYLGDTRFACKCTPDQIERYQARLSGPFLDRIDLHVNVSRITHEIESTQSPAESSAVIRERVCRAHEIQMQRQTCTNQVLYGERLSRHCELSRNNHVFLNTAASQFNLSMRAKHRVLKVARTIADLNASNAISQDHLKEALSYRSRFLLRG